MHEKSNNPGPHIAYMREYISLWGKGIEGTSPRLDVLKNIKTIVKNQRRKVFHPVIMLDVNGDPNYKRVPDLDMRQFIRDLGLVDVYH